MGLRFKNQDPGECFFVTTSFHMRKRLGESQGVYEALAQSLAFCLDKYDGLLPGFVFMPSHVHLLLVLSGDRLGNLMRDFKKYTAQKSLRRYASGRSQLWEERFDRVAIYSEKHFRRKLNYIHQNPVKAGLSRQAEEWAWSSARVYLAGLPCQIPVWTDWSF